MTTESLYRPGETGSLSAQARWQDIPAALILLVALFTAASRLDATNWANGLAIIPYLVIIGTVTGLALGLSSFRIRWVGLLGLAYGVYFIGWQIGSTLENYLPWKERLLIISERSSLVLSQIVNRQPVTDSILFVVVMAILFWALSILAGFMLTRYGNAWLAILPTGLAIFTIQSFDPLVTRRSLYLAVYLFFSLVLIARLAYLHNQSRWKRSQTALPPHLGLDFIRFGLTIVTIIVVIAWTAPALARTVPIVAEASQPIRQQWADIRHRWENAFSSLRSTIGVYSDAYGDSISLGRGNFLTDTPVLVVSPPERTPIGIRYYWRALVYDHYSDGGWENSAFQEEVYDPDQEPFQFLEYNGRWEDTFEFIPTIYISNFYSPSQPSWVSNNARVELAENSDGTVDIAGFRTNQILRPQQPYQTTASIPNTTVSQLRKAGEEYPVWVTDRYLELPESITPRTRQLAEQITADLETPYDKVLAVTNYLRNNIEYQETVPPIPNGKEPIDWFLFDFKKGFCNYYASAEVILLRAAGVPARWSIGYAQGERLDDGRYLVRQRDAHSWPEVFFPGIGWVEFEPTVSQPEIVRLSGEQNDNSANGLSPEEELDELRRNQREELANQPLDLTGQTSSQTRNNWPTLVVIGFAVLLATGSGYILWRNRKRIKIPAIPVLIEASFVKIGLQPPKLIQRWAWQAKLPHLSKSYHEINRALIRLGEAPNPNLTPGERADQLGRLFPPTDQPAKELTHQYQIAAFSLQSADYNIAKQAGVKIRNLSYKASIRRLLRRFQR